MATIPGSKRLLDIDGDKLHSSVQLGTDDAFLDSTGSSGSNGQVLSSTGSAVKWVNDQTGTNNYVSGISFSKTNGVLTLTRSGLADLTVDLDGRYLTSASNFYLDGITKSGNTLTFSVSGATNQTYTYGSNAFNSSTIYAEPGIFSGSGTPTLASGVTGAEVRSLIGAGTGSGSMSSWTIKEGNGTESTGVTNGETFTIAQGTGITSEMTSTSSGGTITITNTLPDTGRPAILSDGTSPTLNTGISAAEVRSLIGAGTGSSNLVIGTTATTAMAGNTTTITSTQATAIVNNTKKVTDSGVPAILSNGTTPTLNSGISAAEVRTLIGAGTSSSSGVTSVASGNTNTLTKTGTTSVTLTPKTAAVTSSSSNLATGAQIQKAINDALTGVLQFEGTWNASTNSPSLASNVGTSGDYYIVSVAGSTNLNGITDWQIGDWAVFANTTWTKVDNSQVGNMSSWTIKEGNGTESTTVTNGETVTIAQGSGIQSEMTSTSSGGTITITNTDRGSSQSIFKNVTNGKGIIKAGSNNDTLTLVGCKGTNVQVDEESRTVTICADQQTLSVSGQTLTISDGNSVTMPTNTDHKALKVIKVFKVFKVLREIQDHKVYKVYVD